MSSGEVTLAAVEVQDSEEFLTKVQQGVWHRQQLEPNSPSWNVATALYIHGELDHVAFEAALRIVVDDADALHARFVPRQDGPRRIRRAPGRWELRRVDVSGDVAPRAAAERLMRADLDTVVDLEHGPLFAQLLLTLSPDLTVWYQRVHHIALDATGYEILRARLGTVYAALRAGEVPAAEEFPSERVLREAEVDYHASRDHDRDRRYWTTLLADHPGPTPISAGAGAMATPAPAAPSTTSPTTGGRPHRSIGRPPSEYEAAERALRRRVAANRSAVLTAAVAVYIGRATGTDDVVLRLPMTGRTDARTRLVPGMAATVVSLRLTVTGDECFAVLVERTAAELLRALRHQRYGIEELRRDLDIGSDRPGGRSSGALVNFLPFADTVEFGPHRAELDPLANGPVDDLAVSIHSDAHGLRLAVDLDPTCHDAEDADAHRDRLLGLLTAAVAEPDRPLGEIHAATEADLAALIGPVSAAGTPATVLSLLADSVARLPNLPAVRDAETTLTYAELSIRSNRLAHQLLGSGHGREEVVGIALSRSVEYVVAVLAVLKAGCALLPLDPQDPTSHLASALAAAGGTLMISRRALVDVDEFSIPVVDLDCPKTTDRVSACSTAEPTDEDRGMALSGAHAAYVITTSGSTGTPRSVVLAHAGLVRLAERHRTEIVDPWARASGRRLRAAHVAPFVFDAAWDPLLLMFTGQELFLVDEKTRRDPAALVEALRRERCDLLETTPSYFRRLLSAGVLDEHLPRPSLVALGGEPLDEELWALLRSTTGVTGFNFYGPTECTVDPLTARSTDDEAVTLGRPGIDVRAYVLDARQRRLGPGSIGELYLAGPGVARGYQGDGRLTASRFLPDPFGSPGSRMFRTGDLVSWTVSGRLRFLRRLDDQVKIRGVRVELGAVEHAVLRDPDVREVGVVTRTDVHGDPVLVAFVVRNGDAAGVAGLRSRLTQTLPAQLVPSLFAELDALPITSRGKLDQQALPESTEITDPGVGPTRARPPTSELEKTLYELFTEVLGVAPAGVDDEFFALGGHSLGATRLVFRINQSLDVRCSLRALFDAPTVASLARRIESETGRVALDD
ncbi:non-ribosomal peptide synthetase [Actinoalloteichus sp. GBA129-24]|uniref:non-ribosomal peptide synthetase n=1 Tax=Actinoalloteichus sp. GBA129-24 TaxID=1612551 RepID=UPI00095052E8|nr:non-ribosomal peptide synthetase [Actinoalloteichus sp. GBA129-24]APU21491.1 amino acid adenylation enzyme/thioester reductase family protein [Actinoalloteichus sp. GBA129-24]